MLAQEQSLQSARKQLASIVAAKPELEPLLQALGGFLTAVAECRVQLPVPDVAAVRPDAALLQQGVPLLEQPAAPQVDYHLATVAPVLLPAMSEAFPAMSGACGVLAAAFEDAAVRTQCAACMAAGTPEQVRAQARQFGMEAEVFGFLLYCLSKPGMEVLAEALAPAMRQIPWTFWLKGQCPICGAAPSMSLLQQGPQEPNEFLKNVSAQRWLCCSHCAHTWRIGRTVCPTCGHDEKEDRRYFYVEDNRLERVELCNHCKHYLLSMDIRDRLTPPDHRLAPLGCIHLDILARQKGYAPQVELPWNRID